LFAGDSGFNAGEFWAAYEEQAPTEDFKDLIEGMLAYNPTSRPTMADILGHRWVRGAVCTKEQFASKCKKFMDLAVAEKKAANEAFGIDHAVDKRERRALTPGADWAPIAAKLVTLPFRPDFDQTTTGRVKRFVVEGKCLDAMFVLYEACKATCAEEDLCKGENIEISDTKWKFSVPIKEGEGPEDATFKMQVEIHELVTNVSYTVTVCRKGGSELFAHKAFNKVYDKFINFVREETIVKPMPGQTE